MIRGVVVSERWFKYVDAVKHRVGTRNGDAFRLTTSITDANTQKTKRSKSTNRYLCMACRKAFLLQMFFRKWKGKGHYGIENNTYDRESIK